MSAWDGYYWDCLFSLFTVQRRQVQCSAYEHWVRKLEREFHTVAFLNVKSCFGLVCWHRYFGGTYCFHRHIWSQFQLWRWRLENFVPTSQATQHQNFSPKYELKRFQGRCLFGRRKHKCEFSIVMVLHQILYFDVLLTVHRSINLGNDQLDTQLIYFVICLLSPLHVSSNVMLIIRRSNCINTASVMVTLYKWPSVAQVERELLCSSLSTCATEGHL